MSLELAQGCFVLMHSILYGYLPYGRRPESPGSQLGRELGICELCVPEITTRACTGAVDLKGNLTNIYEMITHTYRNV